ncbi:uncharacterized protein LOC123208457 [Mangifera indica]|uniref:uncharacterized protein LOC123208457 n=1 Tax=Mangifera indica TaxID=29780 RepID=UPI001CF96286|nr:uncharacterized protein LOC123208457 [Mangifera indica]
MSNLLNTLDLKKPETTLESSEQSPRPHSLQHRATPPTQIELSRFRAVCRSFRFAVPLPSPKLSPVHYYYDPGICEPPLHLVIAESTVYAFQPLSHGAPPWIVKVEKSSQGETRVQDTYSRRHFEEQEISKGYRIDWVFDEHPRQFSGWKDILFQKVALSADNDELAVMVFLNLELMVWRSCDKKWVDLGFGEDIAYYKKKFHVVMSNGHILSVDPKSLEVGETLPPLLTRFTYKSFVNTSSELYLIKNRNSSDKKLGNKRNFSLAKAEKVVLNSIFYVFRLDEEE